MGNTKLSLCLMVRIQNFRILIMNYEQNIEYRIRIMVRNFSIDSFFPKFSIYKSKLFAVFIKKLSFRKTPPQVFGKRVLYCRRFFSRSSYVCPTYTAETRLSSSFFFFLLPFNSNIRSCPKTTATERTQSSKNESIRKALHEKNKGRKRMRKER